MVNRAFRNLLLISFWVLLMVGNNWGLPKGIHKGRMELTQSYKEENVYGKDIYQGIFKYKDKKVAFGYIIPMIKIYNKADNVILEAFTYIDFTKVKLVKGAYAEFFVYTPYVASYDHHEIELYLVEEKYVKNYETVVATQTLFANSIAKRRRIKTTATEHEVELFNKHQRHLKPPMEPMDVLYESKNRNDDNRSDDTGKINWNSPFTYGFKWGGFDKKDNFLKY